MICEHPSFEPPPNPNARLWRYYDLPKFLSLIQSQTLFFARSDLLGDPYEGAFTQANIALWDQAILNEAVRKEIYGADVNAETAELLRRQIVQGYEQFRQRIFINCWHASDYESAAMWSQYAQAGQAIAVQTSFGALAEALPPCVSMGVVKYLDYNTECINANSIFNPFMRKRRSFEHEKEVRAVYWDTGDNPDDTALISIGKNGASVPVRLPDFIESVYLGPLAPSWFVNVIQDVVSRYGLSIPVRQSDLMAPPIR